MRKFSQKFKTGVSVAAVVIVLFGVYGYRKLQALAADPMRKGLRPRAFRWRAGQDRSGADQGDCAATGRKMVAARRQHQRCKLSQQDRNLRRRRGAQRRRHCEDAGLCARQQALGHDRRRAPQHGRAGFSQGRHRAGYAGFQQDRTQREYAVGHGAAGGNLARYPERAASALCGSGHAVDRYFQRRRFDFRHRPRHGLRSLRRIVIDAGDADGCSLRHFRGLSTDLFDLGSAATGVGVIARLSSSRQPRLSDPTAGMDSRNFRPFAGEIESADSA